MFAMYIILGYRRYLWVAASSASDGNARECEKFPKKIHIISGRPENDDDSDYMSHGEWRVANFTQLRYYTHMKLISRKIDKLQSFCIITWHAIFYDYAFCCNQPDGLN